LTALRGAGFRQQVVIADTYAGLSDLTAEMILRQTIKNVFEVVTFVGKEEEVIAIRKSKILEVD
jgi:hypothetical protein